MNQEAKAEHLTFENADQLAEATADWLCGLALASERPFAICLSGGSTPRKLYEALASRGSSQSFPWRRSHWFWGDERFVPHDHPDSNYRMAREALLCRVPIPNDNIHPIPTEGLPPEDAAIAYERGLKRFYGGETLVTAHPLFDVTLLGIGEDGHTASLFPGQQSLDEPTRWVLDVKSPNGDPRITLTYPPLQSSRDIVFLATGSSKQPLIAKAWTADSTLPAARVRPVGRLRWFLDRAATPQTDGYHGR